MNSVTSRRKKPVSPKKYQSLHDEDCIKALLQIVSESACLITPDGMMLACNTTAAERLGSTPEQLAGTNVFDRLPEPVASYRKKKIRTAIESRRLVTFEDRRDGIDFRHSVLPVFTHDGTVKAVAVFAVDITRQKLIESRSSDNRALLDSIVSNISDSVFLIDYTGGFRFVGSNVSTIFGYSRKQVLKMRSITALIPELARHVETFTTMVAVSNLECDIETDQHQTRTVCVSLTRVAGLDDVLLVVCRDVTERKNTGNELFRKNAALSELITSIDQEKNTLLSNIDLKIRKLVMPIIDMVADRPACSDLAALLRSSLTYATSLQHSGELLLDYNLSPREMQLCNMIRNGMSMKQIAHMLSISPLTVEKQRKSIRRKLGIADGKTNLSTYLNRITA